MSAAAKSWSAAAKTDVKITPAVTLILGFLTAAGPVSTDMYLPAFPTMEADLHGWPGSAQITLAAWFVGLALGQLTQGSLSDRFGRRLPLLLGTTVFTAASIGCAMASDIPVFSVWRVVAALGGSASMVVPRAMVRDSADGHQAASLMARLMLIMGVVPVLAPALGGAVLAVASWRVIFWAASIYGAICIILVAGFLPDTLPRDQRLKLSIAGIASRYVAIGRERGFVTNALQGGLAMGALFAYLGGSPNVFIDAFHVSPTAYGALFGLNACGLIGTAQFTPRLLARIGAHALLRHTEQILLATMIALNIAAFTGFGGLFGIAAPLFVCLASLGALLPTSAVGALSRHAAHAGSASALMGTWQFAIAAVSGTLVGLASDGTARPMAILMLICVLASMVADYCRPVPVTLDSLHGS
jgi:DHA1 family bicyclomycin/chloramphenicol resistance-like MFS transporter